MTVRKNLLSVMILMAVLLSACGGAASTPVVMDNSSDGMIPTGAKPTVGTMGHDTPTPGAMPADTGMTETPAWFANTFTDARTGQTFSINDLKGKVVLVETMAMWCSNCMQQQGQVKALHQMLGQRDDFVSIGLDIDPGEKSLDMLKNYVENNGFDWLYSLSPADVSREVAKLYGDQFLNPPSTPILIVDRHGMAHPLPFGIKSAEDLMKAIEPFLNESM
jgi:cytochrome oxidase Cu insertion factor (SCO1/SenC/PrrC family)